MVAAVHVHQRTFARMLLTVLLGCVFVSCGDDADTGAASTKASTTASATESTTTATSITSNETDEMALTATATAVRPTAGMTVTTANETASPSVESVIESLHSALRRDGEVFHTTMTQTFERDATTIELWTLEVWLDAAGTLGRSHYLRGPDGGRDSLDEATTILAGDDVYITSPGDSVRKEAAQDCSALDEPRVINFLLCDPAVAGYGGTYPPFGWDEMLIPRIEAGVDHNGIAAVAIVLDSEQTPLKRRLLLDAATRLPLAWILGGPQPDSTTVITFQNEFVALNSLEDGFFDSAALGYIEPDAPLDDPNLGILIYWLGLEFIPDGELPPLALYSAGPDCCGARSAIEYSTADGSSTVRLRLWHPTDWQTWLARDPATDQDAAVFRLFWDAPCAQQHDIDLGDGIRAIVFLSHRSAVPSPDHSPMVVPTPDGSCNAPFDRFLAHVSFPDVVVTINGASYFEQPPSGSEIHEPYNSAEGIETLVRALRRRE